MVWKKSIDIPKVVYYHSARHTYDTHRCLPLLLVYSSAAWKQAILTSFRLSSIARFIVKPWSGLTLGRERRSVERTKKLP